MRSSGPIPNPQEWHLVSDVALNDIFDRSTSDTVGEGVLRASTYLYRCEQ